MQQQMIDNKMKKNLSFALRRRYLKKKSLFRKKSPLVDAFQKKNDDEKEEEKKHIINMNKGLRLNVSFQIRHNCAICKLTRG